MRILIVEDDPVCRLFLTKCLQHVGETETAADGQLGLQAIYAAFKDGRLFDLICLDIMMPKLDGQSLLRVIRAMETEKGIAPGAAAKVIMTTALNDRENVVEAIPRCDAYLTKPIDRGDLMFYIKKFGFLDQARR
ncbi:MAG TPA: response regulator [Bacteroidota bacterium]|nr:response regulator [Bacteroidota bacterium]